ncbi:hypothetical protein AMATHDRAFT_3484 [Amanita thiersii Skay4041]|uniref:G-protein coupled receptors family 1 profile domain-containing protein n=1 Tax=Amanita thiersii Skay4041 TaxID=703135 RepID=A0A2A9NJ08_9AGAR|nr:hypothetical protein AMATHDRAFT_3484 [Amanita thiersii Skay4041]
MPYTSLDHDLLIARDFAGISYADLVNSMVKLLHPLYTTLIVTCIWSAMLVPLLVALFFFSTRNLRKKPIFIGNLLAILLGMSLASVIIALLVSVLNHPLDPPSRSLALSFASLLAFSPILVESILIIRLLAVYPFGKTPHRHFFPIFTWIGLLKIARVVNAIDYVVNISRAVKPGMNTLLLLQEVWTRFPNYKIEWFLQVADNTSTSVLFLIRLNKGRTLSTENPAHRIGSERRFSTYASRLEALFWIAVSNFVIPVLLSIAQLIVVWLDNSIFDVVPICLVNIYVEIIGVLLATVWVAAGSQWEERKTDQMLTSIQFTEATSPTSSGHSRSSGPPHILKNKVEPGFHLA